MGTFFSKSKKNVNSKKQLHSEIEKEITKKEGKFDDAALPNYKVRKIPDEFIGVFCHVNSSGIYLLRISENEIRRSDYEIINHFNVIRDDLLLIQNSWLTDGAYNVTLEPTALGIKEINENYPREFIWTRLESEKFHGLGSV